MIWDPINLAPDDVPYSEWEVTAESLRGLVEYGVEFELVAYIGDTDSPNDVRIRLPEPQPAGSRGEDGRMEVYIHPMIDGSNELSFG